MRRSHDPPEGSEEHTSELQSPVHLVCRLLLEKKKTNSGRRRTPRSLAHHRSLRQLHNHLLRGSSESFFFFNDPATTEIYTLSLHAALPISPRAGGGRIEPHVERGDPDHVRLEDRKSTRLNSSHPSISYAVFCLKKKKK